MDVFTDDVRDGSLIKLLYPRNLTLCEEALGEIIEKCERWKKVLEGQGLWMNVQKTRGMQLLYNKKTCYKCVSLWIFVVNGSVVNSIWCTKCQKWVCHCCSDVPKQISLLSCEDVFDSWMYVGHNSSVNEKVELKCGEDVPGPISEKREGRYIEKGTIFLI